MRLHPCRPHVSIVGMVKNETKNGTDAQPSGMSIHDAFKSLSDRVDGMEPGCKHAFMNAIIGKLWRGSVCYWHRFNSMQAWNEAIIDKAVMDDSIVGMDVGRLLLITYNIITLQELDRFMALESYGGVFTADDFKRAYALNRSTYNSAMYAWRWLGMCRSINQTPMTVSLLAAEEHSLRICEALVQDAIQGYSFEKHSSDEMQRAGDMLDGRIGLVGVDALGEASKNLAESGMPIEFVKETALMASDDSSIPNTHDNEAERDKWTEKMNRLKQDYMDSLNHRAMYVAYHLRQAEGGTSDNDILMQPYTDDETVEAWFSEMRKKLIARDGEQQEPTGSSVMEKH